MNVEEFPLSDANGPYTEFKYVPSVSRDEESGEFMMHAKCYQYYGGGNWDEVAEYGEGTIDDSWTTYEEAMMNAVVTAQVFAEMEKTETAFDLDAGNDRHYWIDENGDWHLATPWR